MALFQPADLEQQSMHLSYSDDSMIGGNAAASGTTLPPMMPNGQYMAPAAPAVAVAPSVTPAATETNFMMVDGAHDFHESSVDDVEGTPRSWTSRNSPQSTIPTPRSARVRSTSASALSTTELEQPRGRGDTDHRLFHCDLSKLFLDK